MDWVSIKQKWRFGPSQQRKSSIRIAFKASRFSKARKSKREGRRKSQERSIRSRKKRRNIA